MLTRMYAGLGIAPAVTRPSARSLRGSEATELVEEIQDEDQRRLLRRWCITGERQGYAITVGMKVEVPRRAQSIPRDETDVRPRLRFSGMNASPFT